MPGSFTDYAENAILNHFFGGVSFAVPTLHLGYFLTASSENGPGSEPTGNGYLRVPTPPSHWLESIAQLTQNTQDIICPRASANQGDVVGVGLFDSSVGGNCLVYFVADSSMLIQRMDSLVILSGALVHQWNTGGFSNFLKNRIFNHIYRAVPSGIESTIYHGLMSGGSTDAVAGTELSAGGYVRQPLANNSANFAAASGGIKRTAATIQYPRATAAQGTAAQWGFWNMASGGQFMAYGPLDPAHAIAVDGQLTIAPGDVEISLD